MQHTRRRTGGSPSENTDIFPSMATPGAMRSSYGRFLQARPTLSTLALGRNQTPSASFSTTAPLCKRRRKARKTNRDMNPARGVSSIYRSGPREPLSMSDIPLPRPVDFKPEVKVDENHGLWGFFPAPGKLLYTPEETEKHGRAWKVEELRKKSWEDLHALWWKCCRERNMIATSQLELERAELGFGRRELENRDEEVSPLLRCLEAYGKCGTQLTLHLDRSERLWVRFDMPSRNDITRGRMLRKWHARTPRSI